MADVTQILAAIEQGDAHAPEELLPLVYDELRRLAAEKLAHERAGQTLQATALVHEAYLRLVGGNQTQDWAGRRHFFAAAAEAMRRILIDRARHKQTMKAGGGLRRLDLDNIEPILEEDNGDRLLALDEGLRQLEAERPRARPSGSSSSSSPAVHRRTGRLPRSASFHLHRREGLGVRPSLASGWRLRPQVRPPRQADLPGASIWACSQRFTPDRSSRMTPCTPLSPAATWAPGSPAGRHPPAAANVAIRVIASFCSEDLKSQFVAFLQVISGNRRDRGGRRDRRVFFAACRQVVVAGRDRLSEPCHSSVRIGAGFVSGWR